MKGARFKKGERLKSRRIIKALFASGHSLGAYPLRLVYMPIPAAPYPVQFTATVPRRKFPRAVQRNRIKRQIREAWRLHKNDLYQQGFPEDLSYAFLVIYVAKEPLPYRDIERGMRKLMQRFRQKEGL